MRHARGVSRFDTPRAQAHRAWHAQVMRRSGVFVWGAWASGGGEPKAPTGDAVAGANRFRSTELACSACHGDNGQGMLAPNITFSEIGGIGTWSYRQFHDAVRLATGPDGVALCLFMSPYSAAQLSEQAIADIYAFLHAAPSDLPNHGIYCQ